MHDNVSFTNCMLELTFFFLNNKLVFDMSLFLVKKKKGHTESWDEKWVCFCYFMKILPVNNTWKDPETMTLKKKKEKKS